MTYWPSWKWLASRSSRRVQFVCNPAIRSKSSSLPVEDDTDRGRADECSLAPQRGVSVAPPCFSETADACGPFLRRLFDKRINGFMSRERTEPADGSRLMFTDRTTLMFQGFIHEVVGDPGNDPGRLR